MEATTLLFPMPGVAYICMQQAYNTDDDLEGLKCVVQSVYDRSYLTHERFVFVFNAEGVNYVQPRLLSRFANWLGTKREENEKYLICSNMIFEKPFIEKCFKIIVSIFKPVKPVYIHRNVAEANSALEAQLKPELK